MINSIKEYYIKNKYLIFFVLSIILFFMGSLFQLIPIKIFNINSDIINNTNELYNPNIAVLLNIFSNVVVAILLFILYKKDLKDEFKTFKKDKNKLLDTGFRIWVVGLCLMAFFNIIIGIITPNKIANNEESIRNMLVASPYLTIICTSILAPFIEEMVFRKSFKTVINNNFIYVITSGIIFGGMHVIFNIDNIYDYLYLLPYCSLGIALSYIYSKTKNIYVPITMHFLHNTITTLIVLFLR